MSSRTGAAGATDDARELRPPADVSDASYVGWSDNFRGLGEHLRGRAKHVQGLAEAGEEQRHGPVAPAVTAKIASVVQLLHAAADMASQLYPAAREGNREPFDRSESPRSGLHTERLADYQQAQTDGHA